ncbi:MAG: hypothetical protein ACJ74U_03015 [Jatrophihabitantaceae bacterium]
MSEEPDPHRTPGAVIAAVAAATVVVPFLIVYSFLFIARGIFVEVEQPDITGSRHGEAAAGLVALAFLAFVLWGMLRMLNGSNRMVFWLGQLIALAVSVTFLLDSSSGDPQVPVVTAAAAALAIALSLTPPATRWVASAGGEREPPPRPSRDATGEPDAGLDVVTEPAHRQG